MEDTKDILDEIHRNLNCTDEISNEKNLNAVEKVINNFSTKACVPKLYSNNVKTCISTRVKITLVWKKNLLVSFQRHRS